MYLWTTGKQGFTWNPLAGRCGHACSYCYVQKMCRTQYLKDKYRGAPRLEPSAMKKDLGGNKTVFVCSMNDLFAPNVSMMDIREILKKAKKHPSNTYLIQTKNVPRLADMWFDMDWDQVAPPKVIIGTTIESNRDFDFSFAPNINDRMKAMIMIHPPEWCDKMVSIEPIVKFDHDRLVEIIRDIDPNFVSIGADSKHMDLPEPTREEVWKLIHALKSFTTVKLKSNLIRIAGQEIPEE